MATLSKILVGAALIFGPTAAGQVSIGPYLGTGLAPTVNAGAVILYRDFLGLDLGYSTGAIDRRCSDFRLVIRHASVLVRPFGGSLYLGAGAGKNDLTVVNTYEPTQTEFTMEASSILTLFRGGWMWGVGNSGFWGGFDVARYQSHSSTKNTDAPGVDPASQDYRDSIAPVEKFAGSNFYTFMFRIGWLFD